MDDIKEKKCEIRNEIIEKIGKYGDKERAEKMAVLKERLLSFANFQESKIAFLPSSRVNEMDLSGIIRQSIKLNKIVVLPSFQIGRKDMTLLKLDDPDRELIKGPLGNMEPDPQRCKVVPIDSIDIAIIPGIAFDEKGGRIGTGKGYFDHFIPKLPITARKVSLAFEDQLIQQVPMESHDKYVDIIITEKRVIYKI
ncbi:MAG: 5-formyltetrahydrofolate cyclo-ligase [Pseudomonadota bacterium]